MSYNFLFSVSRLNVEIARGTPHGRDRERWGTGRGGRDRSPRDRRDSRDGRRPVWLDKYGPPTRTDYKVVVENLSSRVSWQVSCLNSWPVPFSRFR